MAAKKYLIGVIICVTGLAACSKESNGQADKAPQPLAVADGQAASSSAETSNTKLPDHPPGLKVIYGENWASENNALSKYAISCATNKGASLIRVYNSDRQDMKYAIEKPNEDFASIVGSESGDGLVSDEEFEKNAAEGGIKFYSTLETAISAGCGNPLPQNMTASTDIEPLFSNDIASQIIKALRNSVESGHRTFTVDNMLVIYTPDALSGRGGSCVIMLAPHNIMPNREPMAEQILIAKDSARAFFGISLPDITGTAPRMKAAANPTIFTLPYYIPGPPKYWSVRNGSSSFNSVMTAMKSSPSVKIDFGATSLGQHVIDFDLRHLDEGLSAISELCP